MDIINFVRESLNADKGNWRGVCAQTGLDYSWLAKFAAGRIPKPGYRMIDALSKHYGITCAMPKVAPSRTTKKAA